ncbi:hypothetical protein CCACVL1_05552 [Corchorus capsularis]|uniref:Uncharacterized protein n=1 Tax=Corchorus capsularis TaxID=210143 RepID=A0A1R3JK13_COCAP|nr:hypothetical protein CCACVL1_05552 [Corchorus capsularis]
MGGCASRPKTNEDAPVEAPPSHENPQVVSETLVQEENKNDGGDQNQNEQPLVDLSEPEKADDVVVAAEPAVAAEEAPKPAEGDVKADVDEVKVEATATTVPVAKEAEADKSDAAAPAKEEDKKDDAPLVTL